MKKIKFFLSMLKERDWLEEMARQGFLLKNITLGIFYEFEKIAPCEKVYEMERFALNQNGEAKRQELTAKKNAMDIAGQMGWQQVTHDENMTYYFVKDRAGDETDEFYDDEESRRNRAERFRKSLAIDIPKQLLALFFVLSILYFILFLLFQNDPIELKMWMGIFVVLSIVESGVAFLGIKSGEIAYRDLLLSREQWENRKKYSEKQDFKKADDMLAYLQQKDQEGLALKNFEDSFYIFEPSKKHYRYYLDTKKAYNNRRKKAGKKIIKDKKDLDGRGINWQEHSMTEAAKRGLEVVAAGEYGTLVYRQSATEPELDWETGVVRTGYGDAQRQIAVIGWTLFAIGFIAGLIAGLTSV